MFNIAQCSPVRDITTYLQRAQNQVDLISGYSEQSKIAQYKWKISNTTTNQNFSEIRALLRSISGEQERCVYCEDSLGAQIDHAYPKSIFPSKTFDWGNFIFSCPTCNQAKSNTFHEIDTTGNIIKIDHKTLLAEPTINTPALLIPAEENPLDYIMLDLVTFKFVTTKSLPSHKGTNPIYFLRAQHTINELGLNSRAGLSNARKAHFKIYTNALKQYLHAKLLGNFNVQKEQQRLICIELAHRAVWEEIKRYVKIMPKHPVIAHNGLDKDFSQAPEAFNW